MTDKFYMDYTNFFKNDKKYGSPYSWPRRHRREVEILLYSFLSLGPRWGWIVSATPWPPCPRERQPVAIEQEDRWSLGTVSTRRWGRWMFILRQGIKLWFSRRPRINL